MNLAGITEIGAMLGVTKQRASQLVVKKGFPARLDDPPLKMGPVWKRQTVVRWAEKQGREVR